MPKKSEVAQKLSKTDAPKSLVDEVSASVVMPKPLTAKEKFEKLGIDAICNRLSSGESQRSIADSLNADRGDFCVWLADDQRSARVREARILSARHWDDMAEAVLLDLQDDGKAGAVTRARELASHYRWRASKYAPRDYGDRLNLEADISVTQQTPEQRAEKIAQLTAKLHKTSHT
jgi:hypothetical protein